jgi:hypothetical protein
MNDIKGKLIGSWLVLEFAYQKERTDNYGKIRRRHYWCVECINCKSTRTIEEHNLTPPAGGKCQSCWGRPKGQSGFLVLLYTYRNNASKNGREFLLSEEQFRHVTSLPCHYCNGPPSKVKLSGKKDAKSHWGNYYYNGLDRINNDMGYIWSNVVPCCMICNRAKNNMSYDSFMSYINRIKGIKGN